MKVYVAIKSALGRTFRNPFHSPYYLTGAVFSRLMVCMATVIWGLIVVFDPDPLSPLEYPLYLTLTRFMPSNHWAIGAIVIGVIHAYWLVDRLPPIRLGALGYASMGLFWVYLALSTVMYDLPDRPAATACILVVGFMALFAFMTNAKRTWRDEPPNV